MSASLSLPLLSPLPLPLPLPLSSLSSSSSSASSLLLSTVFLRLGLKKSEVARVVLLLETTVIALDAACEPVDGGDPLNFELLVILLAAFFCSAAFLPTTPAALALLACLALP